MAEGTPEVGAHALAERLAELEEQIANAGVPEEFEARVVAVEEAVEAAPSQEVVTDLDDRLTAVEESAGGGGPQSEIQVIHMYTADGSAISSGNWSVNPGAIGGETSSVPHNASSIQLKDALEVYGTLAGNVTVVKELDTSNERRWRITYDPSLGDVGNTSVVTNTIGTDGGPVTIAITTEQTGVAP